VILGLAVGMMLSIFPALLILAGTRHRAPTIPEPPEITSWAPQRPPQNVLVLNLDELVQRRAALTPPPPQYLQLSEPDGNAPGRIVGKEEWT